MSRRTQLKGCRPTAGRIGGYCFHATAGAALDVGVLIELNDWSSLILDYEENFRGSGSERYAGIRASFRF